MIMPLSPAFSFFLRLKRKNLFWRCSQTPLFHISWGGVKLSPRGTSVTIWSVVPVPGLRMMMMMMMVVVVMILEYLVE
jgi:hypothetical protein